MKIGIAFDLKHDSTDAHRPDDWQEEFDSPATVAALRAALESGGHTVVEFGNGRQLVSRLLTDPPDLVFNIAEGIGTDRNREARVPAVCDLLGIAYTGSDPLTLAASLDKDVARRLVASAGVPVPLGVTLQLGDDIHAGPVPFPAIIKPAWEGSSKGVRGKCIVRNERELIAELPRLWKDYEQPVLVEEFIAGDELTVAVLGQRPARVLGIMHVIPKHPNSEFVYSLEVKRDWEARVRYACPPEIDADAAAAVEASALVAYRALGCRDISRIDFRLRDGIPYFLEANPLPGLNPETGDIVLTAKAMGIKYQQLILEIVKHAGTRIQPAK